MASNDQELLKSVLSQRRAQVAPDSTSQDYFELFCAEQILKNFGLTYDDLQAGVVDGEHDGGVDSVHGFVNGELMHEDFDCASFKKDVQLELHIIQSKTSEGFRESAINSLISTTRHLLTLDANYDTLTQYNSSVKAAFNHFREACRALASTFPSLTIHYHYASRNADAHIHDNLLRKADELKEIATEMFPGVDVRFDFLGARRLLELARRRPRTTHELRVIKNLSDVNGYIVLSRLDEYARFLRNSTGGFRADLFESNVRDFQGNTEVNAEIVNTLRHEMDVDFWWMNNGVTILASRATLTGDTVTIENPQIVNGLQTSTQIAQACAQGSEDGRKVMIKVISSEDEETRDKIIKATNRQNPIQPATLRATDKIQRDIETALKSVGLFYDRRKNHYKNQDKPLNKIVSIPLMAQSLMAVILGRPDQARARPSSLIKKDEDYARLFSEQFPVQIYTAIAELVGRIDAVLKGCDDMKQRDRTNLRFYVLYWVAAVLTRAVVPTPSAVSRIDVRTLPDEVIREATEQVRKLYDGLGATDQVAKGSELRVAIAEAVAKRVGN